MDYKITANVLTSLPVGNGKIDEVARVTRNVLMVSPNVNQEKHFLNLPLVADNSRDRVDKIQPSVGAKIRIRLRCYIRWYSVDRPDWVTTKTIGLKLSTLKISQVLNGEADDKMFYKVSGEIAEGRSLKRVKLPADVLNVINA